jgi:hypothetical protein
MNTFKTEQEQREQILNSKFGFNDDYMKNIFPNVNKEDYSELKDLMLEKVDELKFKMRTFDKYTLERMTAEQFKKELEDYIGQLNVEYNKYGLKKIYDKIKKVLEVIPENNEYKEDKQIIQEIKKEYIETKKINRSSMLYLNKIYRQLTREKSDEKEKDTAPPISTRDATGIW